MALVDGSAAAQAVEENKSLRGRLTRLEDEEQRTNSMRNEKTLDTTSADRLQSRNNSIRDDIAELEHELKELRTVNVTELHHLYTRLDNKRAHLNNENVSLRNVLANQRKDVKRANGNVSTYQEVRRQNEEQHAAAKDDIKSFKDRRELMQKETNKLSRKEARLQSELTTMPSSATDMAAEYQRLLNDNAKKDEKVAELQRTLKEVEAEADKGSRKSSTTSEEDVAVLRREYIALKEQLRQLKS